MTAICNPRLNFLWNIFILITFFGNLSIVCSGQDDTAKTMKNTVRMNITNPMLFGWKYNVIGYERVIKDHQTASVSFGRLAFPRLVSSHLLDSLGLAAQQNDRGINFSIDYRFYLRKENKYTAPRGIYFGPYYSYNYFSRDLTWNINTSVFSGTIGTTSRLTGNLFGVQMGYQFILWNRLTIDMILFGPGKWYFHMNTDFNSSLSEETAALVLEKLNEKFKEKFPGSEYVFKGTGFEAKKSTGTSISGLRYLVNIGFRF